MTTGTDLQPQVFSLGSNTVVPAVDFYAVANQILPDKYRMATNFMAIIKVISDQKQYLYDVIRSLTNVYNLYSSRNTVPGGTQPTDVYLRMLASDAGAPYDSNAINSDIADAVSNRFTSVSSRGTIKAFYDYFEYNELGGYFNNSTIQEDGNASILIIVPINNSGSPNPFLVFQQDIFRIKAAGIYIVSQPAVIPYFQYADLLGNVGPGNKGYAGLTERGNTIGGGYYTPLP